MNATNTESYSQRAKRAKAERGLKIPNGRYKGPLKSFECKTNTKGNIMMVAGLLPATCLTPEVLANDPEIMGKLIGKGKEARKWMTLHNPGAKFNPHAGFEDQLTILLDAGMPVDMCRPYDQDPNYEDFKSLWHQMMAQSPTFTFDVKWEKEDDQYPNVRIVEVEPHPSTLVAVDNQTAQMAQAVATPPAPAAGVATPPAPPAPPAYTGPSRAELKAAGWTDEQINESPEYKNAPEA
jgi:hypothetical protein